MASASDQAQPSNTSPPTQLDRIEADLAEMKRLLSGLIDAMADEGEDEEPDEVEVVTMDGQRYRVPRSPLDTL